MDYITPSTKQYKANLHCHSTLSDGKLTPEELIRAYREQGYAILAITDHESPYDHTGASTSDFLLLTGYEVYIRPTSNGRLDLFGPEIHMNLLARDPHNTTIIGYDPKFFKYMPHELAEKLAHKESVGPRSYSREYIQSFIQTAREQGYLVTYNHPCWSMENPDDVLSYDGCFSMEIFNTSSMKTNGYEYNMAIYDAMLRRGKFLFCHGADDNHNVKPFGDPLCDSFGSWTMILAEELTYPAVIRALERGDFYASTGPSITALTFQGGKIHLECSPAARVIMHRSPKSAVSCYDPSGAPVTSADFEFPERPGYVYFSVLGQDGTSAHTRAFRREELGL